MQLLHNFLSWVPAKKRFMILCRYSPLMFRHGIHPTAATIREPHRKGDYCCAKSMPYAIQ